MGFLNQKKEVPSKLKLALQNLYENQNPDNMKRFISVLKDYIDAGDWVCLPVQKNDRGFLVKIIEIHGMHFAVMFSDQTEINNREIDNCVLTDINKLIEPVFQNKHIDGIVIDPSTTSLCLEKRFLLKCLLHGHYPRQKNSKCEPKNWGTGIPVYTQNDLMSSGEIQNFAIETVLKFVGSNHPNDSLSSACDFPGAIPSLILERDSVFTFVLVKGYATIDEPQLGKDERDKLIELGRKYNAKCFFAPVGFRSSDPARFDACLALKGDRFYCKFEGLREVKQ